MLGSAYKTAMERIPRQLRVIPAKDDAKRCFDEPPRGQLVFLSSLASQTICSGLADYCASKAGISALAETLRLELEVLEMGKNIAVTEIRPFVVDTGLLEGLEFKLVVEVPVLFNCTYVTFVSKLECVGSVAFFCAIPFLFALKITYTASSGARECRETDCQGDSLSGENCLHPVDNVVHSTCASVSYYK